MPFMFVRILEEFSRFSVLKPNSEELRMIRIEELRMQPGSIRDHLSQICVICVKVVAAFAEAGGSFLEVPSLF
jgi:hypothetical protein